MTSVPSLPFKEQVRELDEIIRHCIVVSRACAGIPAPTGAHYYASVLFTSLCTRGVSLAILAPYSSRAKKKTEHWDYSSIAGITRSILEVRLAFYYLCVEECMPEEWQCRWNLFNLHDSTSRIHLFESIPNNEKDLNGFRQQAEELRARLTNNPFFQGLPQKQRNKLISGGHAYLSSLEDIAIRASVDLHTFRLLYKLLSSQVHCLPLSFYRMGEQNRGRGVQSEVEEFYINVCLSVAVALLVAARDEMKRLFPVTNERSGR